MSWIASTEFLLRGTFTFATFLHCINFTLRNAIHLDFCAVDMEHLIRWALSYHLTKSLYIFLPRMRVIMRVIKYYGVDRLSTPTSLNHHSGTKRNGSRSVTRHHQNPTRCTPLNITKNVTAAAPSPRPTITIQDRQGAALATRTGRKLDPTAAYGINRAEEPGCACKTANQTVPHIIEECPLYRTQRRKHFSQPVLYHVGRQIDPYTSVDRHEGCTLYARYRSTRPVLTL
jgi:hypothetical protein